MSFNEFSFDKPALPIDFDTINDNNLNSDSLPMTGNDYLRRVQIEAMNCPSVVVADVRSKLSQKKEANIIKSISGCQPAPEGFAPDMQWQLMQVAAFSKLREGLAQQRNILKKKKISPLYHLPSLDNVDGWYRLCFGCSYAKLGNFIQQTVDEHEDGGALDTLERVPPLVSIITAMKQPTVIAVLEYHINWFEATGFTHDQGQWFFSLLAALEKPLTPEACSLLRTLARHCASLRATLDGHQDPILVQLNLLICLVSRYFDQTDLADKG